MTAKQFLGQARALDARINAMTERVTRLRALAERRTAAYGPWAGRGDGDRRGEILARLVDAERELDDQIDRLVDLKREIAAAIDRVEDPRLCALLELRYVNGCSWREVAERLHYSEANVKRLHAAALRRVEVPSR